MPGAEGVSMAMLRKIGQKYRQKPLMVKMSLSYMLLGSLLISVYAFLLVGRIANDWTNEILEQSEQTVYQSYIRADLLLMNTYRYYYQEFNNDELMAEAMYGKDLDRITIGRINARMTELMASQPLVRSIYVYNFQDNLVFSTLSTSRKIDEFYDRDMTRIVQERNAYGSRYFIPRKERFEIYGHLFTKNVISMVYSHSEYGSHPHGVMVVNLDQQVLQQLVTDGNADTTTISMIIDGDGFVISHPDGAFINANIGGEPYFQEINENGNKKGLFLSEIDGKQVLVTWVKSDRLGWSFVAVSDYKGLIHHANTAKRFILLNAVVFALLGMVAAGVFTNMFYRPVRQLLNRLRAHPAAQVRHDSVGRYGEYEFIARTFDNLEDMVKRLQSDLRHHLPESKKALLQSMIHGSWKRDDGFAGKYRQWGIRLKEEALRVLVIRLDRYAELVKMNGSKDLLLFKFAVSNIAEDIFRERMEVETIEDAPDSVAVILSGSVDAGETERLANDVVQAVSRYLKLSVTIGLGMRVECFEELRHSWTTAAQAASFRIWHGGGQVFQYANPHPSDKRNLDYPLKAERKITTALKAGDVDAIRKGFDEFVTCMRGCTYEEVMLSLHQLMFMTLRTYIEMSDVPSDEWMLELQDAHNKLRSHDTIEDIRLWFVGLCEQMIRVRSQRAASRVSEQVKKMMERIHQDYSNPNLSADELAQYVGLSTNYARKVFKEQTGMSISQYLDEYRFKQARDMLMKTDIPAYRIGELVGMTNTSYFYVKFKKYFGKTPDHYRKTYRLNGERVPI
jgi:AraC-like DNA-binding protein